MFHSTYDEGGCDGRSHRPNSVVIGDIFQYFFRELLFGLNTSEEPTKKIKQKKFQEVENNGGAKG